MLPTLLSLAFLVSDPCAAASKECRAAAQSSIVEWRDSSRIFELQRDDCLNMVAAMTSTVTEGTPAAHLVLAEVKEAKRELAEEKEGFSWGSAAVGAGVGAVATAVVIAVVLALSHGAAAPAGP